MLCKFCQKPLDEGARFCRYCGKEIQPRNSLKFHVETDNRHIETNRVDNVKNRAPKKDAVLLTISGVVLLAAVCCICLLFSSNKNQSQLTTIESTTASGKTIDRITSETDNYFRVYEEDGELYYEPLETFIFSTRTKINSESLWNPYYVFMQQTDASGPDDIPTLCRGTD